MFRKLRSGNANRILRIASILLIITLGLPWSVVRGQQTNVPSIEYQVKASMLLNFIRFIEWPDSRIDENAPIRLCVIGRDEFGSALEALERDLVRGRPIAVDRYASIPAGPEIDCQMVFISRSEQVNAEQFLKAIEARGTVTVGESDGFAEMGGVVQFRVIDGRVRFDINQSSARAARVQVSSKLLRLANRVIQ